MNLAQFSLPELVGILLGFMFTLFVFSYIFGDNALFRIAMSIFVGVASAYAGVVAWYNVIWPQLFRPLIFGSQSERLFVLIPLFFCGLLLLKVSPRFSRIGNPAIGIYGWGWRGCCHRGSCIGDDLPTGQRHHEPV